MLEIKVYGMKQDGSNLEGGHPWMLTDSSTRSVYHFPAYRAHVPDMKSRADMLPFAEGFKSDKPCKIITTKKGGLLLVNCSEEQDEHITLLTAYGPFRGTVHSVYRLSGDIKTVTMPSISTKNCAPQWNAILRGEGDLLIIYYSPRDNRKILEINNKQVTLDNIVEKYGLDYIVVNLADETSPNDYWQEQAAKPIKETYWGKKYKPAPTAAEMLAKKFNNH